MAENNFLDTQVGGESPSQEDVASQEVQKLDLSPKESKQNKDLEQQVEDESKKQIDDAVKGISQEPIEDNTASNYIPVSETSVDSEIPTSAENSTAKKMLSGGTQELANEEKMFNEIGGINSLYEDDKKNAPKDNVDDKMEGLMSENGVIVEGLNVDNSDIFNIENVKTLKTNSFKLKDDLGNFYEPQNPIIDVDDETEEAITTSEGFPLRTDLDLDIYENRDNNRNNKLISEGIDGKYNYDIGEGMDQDGVASGGPTEEDDGGPNGYYIMKGKAYYKTDEGEWYKLYPTEEYKTKKYSKEGFAEGYNVYNSKWVKLDKGRRTNALERKAQFFTYREIKEKDLLRVSNEQIRRLQEGYNDSTADLSGEFQYLEEVGVQAGLTGPWGYEEKLSREDARKKIGKKRGNFLANGDYKFAGRDYVKKGGKWFYKNENGSLDSIYGEDKEIIKLERAAIPKGLLNSKNMALVEFFQGMSTMDVSDMYVNVVKKIDNWAQSLGLKGQIVKGFDWIISEMDKNPNTLNARALEIATMISEKWTSGNLTSAEYEIIKSFGVLRDEYLNYGKGENKSIFEENVGSLGDIWRSPDKAKDILSDLYQRDDLKKGMEMIAYLANGNDLQPTIKSNGIYHIGGDYLLKRGGNWYDFDGTRITDKKLIKAFNSTSFPGAFSPSDISNFAVQSLSPSGSNWAFLNNLDETNKKKTEDLTIQEEVYLMLNGVTSIAKETDLYKMYNSNPVIKILLEENLRKLGIRGMSIDNLLKSPPEDTDKEFEQRLNLREKLSTDLITQTDAMSLLSTKTVSANEMNEIMSAISKSLSDFNAFEYDKSRLKWFSENSFSESQMNENQREIISEAQEEAIEILNNLESSSWTMETLEMNDKIRMGMFRTQQNAVKEFVSQIDQFVSVAEESNRVTNEIKETGQSQDLIFFNRKESYQKKFSQYLPGGLSDNLKSSVDLFSQKKNLARYVLDLEQEGLLDISEDGKLSYTEKATSMGREYIQNIDAKISSMNKMIELKRSESFDANNYEIAKLDASIRNSESMIDGVLENLLKLDMSEEDRERAQTQLIRLNENMELLKARKSKIKAKNYTVLLTGAKEMAEDLVGSTSKGFLNPYLSALENVKDLSAKNKFDLMVETMTDRLEELVTSGDVNTSYLGRVTDKLADLLDWDGWFELDDNEKEYYQLALTLKSVMPLYLNNEYAFEAEDRGYFDSLMRSFYNAAFPVTAPASASFAGSDLLLERTQAQAIGQVVKSAGIKTEDLTGIEKLDQLTREIKRESKLGSAEFWGEVTGPSLFYIGGIGMSGWVTGGLFKMGVAVQRLSTGTKGLTIMEKTYNALPKIYMNSLGRSKFGKFFAGPDGPIAMAWKFKRTGLVFGASDEEMTALGGFMGGAGVKGLRLFGRAVTPKKFNEFAEHLFGKDRWASMSSNISFYGGLGIGELTEETMQVFAKAFNQLPSMENFYKELGYSFGSSEKIAKHVTASIVMGVLMGTALTPKTKTMYEGLDAEAKSKVDEIVKSVANDLNASMDVVTDYVQDQTSKAKNIQENDSKDATRVSSEEQVGKKPVQEESVEKTSEEKTSDSGVVQEEQVETKEKTQEEKTEKEEVAEEQSNIEKEEQVVEEKTREQELKEEFPNLSDEQQSSYKAKAKEQLEQERRQDVKNKKKGFKIFGRNQKIKGQPKNRISEEEVNERAAEIYSQENLRKNIGKNINKVKGQRVTITVNQDSDYAGVDMTITDEFGNNIGNVKGVYDANGNLDIEEINITEGKRGQQYATETIETINQNTNNNVVLSKATENTQSVGKSLEEGNQAVQDESGNYVVNNTNENVEANEGARAEYKQDESLADRIRSAKIQGNETTLDENGNEIPAPKRNSVKFFDAAWNASVEAAAQIAEKGGSLYKTLAAAQSKFKKTAFYQSFETVAEKEQEMARFMMALEEQLGTENFTEAQKALDAFTKRAIRKFKDSAYYKSFPPRSKGRQEALAEFKEKLSNDADAILSEKLKKRESIDVDKMVGEYASEERVEKGPLDLKMSIAEKIKAGKKTDLGVIKEEIIAYMKKALPDSKYTKNELIVLANRVASAKTIAAANNVFKDIDNKAKRKNEQARKENYRKTKDRIDNLLTTESFFKSGKLRISEESYNTLQEFLEENNLSQEALEAMTNEELVIINNTIDEIIEKGRYDQKMLVEQRNIAKRTKQAEILKGFETLEGKRTSMTAEEVAELNPKEVRGSFIIDGQLFPPGAARDYVKDRMKAGEDVLDIEFYKAVDPKYDLKEKQKPSAIDAGLSISDFYGKMKAIYSGKYGSLNKVTFGALGRPGFRGNQALREHMDKIDNNLRWAFAMEQSANQEFEDLMNSHLAGTFGKSFIDRAGRFTGLGSMLPGELKAQAENTAQFFNDGVARKITNDEIVDLYLYGLDPDVREALQPDPKFGKTSYNMDAVDRYVEANPNLLKHAEWINNYYNNTARAKFEPMFKKYKDVPGFKDTYYYPRNTRVENQTDEDVQNSLMDKHGLAGILITPKSAANSHLEDRTDVSGASIVVEGATVKMMKYMDAMNHANYFIDVAQDLSDITNNKSISDAIILQTSKSTFNKFKQHAEMILSGDQSLTKPLIKGGAYVVDLGTTAAVVTQLGLNTANIPKQLSSAFHWMNEGLKYGMPPFGISIKAVAKSFQQQEGESSESYNQRMAITKMIMNSPFVRQRWNGGDIDVAIQNVIQEGSGRNGLQRMIAKGSKFALLYTRLGDMGGVVLGGIPFTYNLYKHYRMPIQDGEEE